MAERSGLAEYQIVWFYADSFVKWIAAVPDVGAYLIPTLAALLLEAINVFS